jgi:hypothetical protein
MPAFYRVAGSCALNRLTLCPLAGIVYPRSSAGVAQLAEQLICNQQVVRSNRIAGSLLSFAGMSGIQD